MTRVGLAAGVIIIVLAAIYFGFRKAAREANESAISQTSASTSSSAQTPTAGSAAGGTVQPVENAPPSRITRIDAATRQRLLDQITAARTRRGERIEAPPGAPNAPRELTKDYIRDRVKELAPLLRECYEKALADDPKLAGKLVVKFTMGGEPEVGGVVEESAIDAETSTIKNANMTECVRETMYGLELDAPAEGGRVVVNYPFVFSSVAN